MTSSTQRAIDYFEGLREAITVEEVRMSVLLPASAVKVGRNRLWQLRENPAERLRPELQKLTTRGRSGEVSWHDARDT